MIQSLSKKLRPPRPVVLCVGTIVCVRAICAALLYATLQINGSWSELHFKSIVKLPYDWLYLFGAWDTGYYYSIAQAWYPSHAGPEWAFFPLYPGLTRVLLLLGMNLYLAAFAVAALSGLISIPLFFKVARRYLLNGQALNATLLYFLFPPIFVFVGVSYSEPLFLLLTLLTWHYHKCHKDVRAAMAAGLASLTRPYGVLIVLPLIYDHLNRRSGKLVLMTIPLILASVWLLYGYLLSGSITILSARAYWTSSNSVIFRESLTRLLLGNVAEIGVLLGFAQRYSLEAVAAVTSVVLFLWLLRRIIRLDRALAAYALASLAVIAYFNFIPGFGSFPRYIAFIFPFGLVLHTRHRALFTGALALSIIFDFVAWWAFLAGRLI